MRSLGSRLIVPALVTGALVLLPADPFRAGSVRGSKHDLSMTGVDPYSDQVCAFCHTPHFANPVVNAPLWNRFVDQSKSYILYDSTSMDTVPGDPNMTISVLCLGCHDGTLGSATVNGYIGSDKHGLVNAPGPGGMPDMTSNPNCRGCHGEFYGDPPFQEVGQDLSNDHPISMTYPTTAQDPAFHTPPDPVGGWPDLKFWQGKIECPTCHNPHDPDRQPFLRKSNVDSALCLTCHIK